MAAYRTLGARVRTYKREITVSMRKLAESDSSRKEGTTYIQAYLIEQIIPGFIPSTFDIQVDTSLVTCNDVSTTRRI